MVVLHVDIFCTWIHVRNLIQCQRPYFIFKSFTQDSWQSCTNVIFQDLHLFEEIYDRNGLMQHLDECDVITISRYEGYFCLKLQLIHNRTSQIWYDRYWARACHIRVILGFLCHTEVIIHPYLDVTTMRADIYAQFSIYLKIEPYSIERLTMFFSWILWESRALVHHIRNIWLITILQVVKLAYNTAIVEFWSKFSAP